MSFVFFAWCVLALAGQGVSSQDIAPKDCNSSDLGDWIIIQRRLSSEVDFYRDWADYKNGFGDTSGNFWLGNDKISGLTSKHDHQLRVELSFKGKDYFAEYRLFKISSEADKYRLEVSGYSGNAGDSLSIQNKMAFSTKDRDNDIYSIKNCAERYHGAWWYGACHNSNLNGQWGSTDFGMGVIWLSLTTHTASATSTVMKIRQVK